MARSPLSVLDRLAAKSTLVGDCQVWTGYCDRDGYGRISVDNRQQRVHRVAWTARHGEPPTETPWVLHRCDNPPCITDAHHWLGTTQDNVADRNRKGRTRGRHPSQCRRGHPYDELNTYVSSKGFRHCRACGRINSRASKLRKAF